MNNKHVELISSNRISFLNPSHPQSFKQHCYTSPGTAVNIVLCSHESWGLLGLIVMATLWISTRLCNHAACLVPRIAGGCLAPEAKANTSRTGHLINPGHHKQKQKDSGEQGCRVVFISIPSNDPGQWGEDLSFDSKVVSTNLPVSNTFILPCTQQVIIPLSRTIRPKVISPGT